jgi:HEAT repeat protein/beta-lactamase regulating signal transducer with metallopeptidase domain
LAGCLAILLLLPMVPRWSLPVLPAETAARPAAVFSTAAEESAPLSAARSGMRATRQRDSAESREPQAASRGPQAGQSSSWRPSLNSLLFFTWAAVAFALLIRLALGIVRVRREVSRPAMDEPWLPLARELAADVGVAHRVAFATGRPDSMPMTWGFRRPVVLLPDGVDAWPVARLRAVLLHELAHVRRYDCLTQTLAGAVCAVYWFNPLAWLAAGRLVAERERACDDAVLAAGADGGDYAEQLLDVARAMRSHGVLTWASVSMARQSQLEGRLLAILDPNLPRRTPTRAAAAILVICLGVLVPSLAALQLAPRAGTETTLSAAPEQSAPAAPQVTPLPRAMQAVPPPAPRPMPTPMPRPAPTPGAAAGEGAGKAETRKPVDQKVIDALTTAVKDTDLEVREHAVMALGQLRDLRATPALVAALADTSADLRESAVQALGQLRDPAAMEPVLAAMKDAEPGVREQAAFALGQMRDKRATPALVTALKDTNADVREQAVFALGQMRDASAVDGLLPALKDSSPDVQQQAAFALGMARDKRAVDALIGALSSPTPGVREHAAFALGQIGDPRATDALMAAMKDAEADVRKAAAFALSQVIARDK